jgi:hypothetical protein
MSRAARSVVRRLARGRPRDGAQRRSSLHGAVAGRWRTSAMGTSWPAAKTPPTKSSRRWWIEFHFTPAEV